MMKNKKFVMILAFVLVAVVAAGVGAYAATNLGTKNDPLVTLSYLDEKLYPDLVSQITQEADAAAAELEKAFAQAVSQSGAASAETYAVVTLKNGQRLVGSVGCEIMLRIGTASVSAKDSPGLVDLSSASSLNDGAALTANHLYMVTIADNGIQATAATVKVLVRGSYTVS